MDIDDASPLAIFLVKSGSTGSTNRLLFRYPYELNERQHSNSYGDEAKKRSANPYAIRLEEDFNEKCSQRSPSVLNSKSKLKMKTIDNVLKLQTELFPNFNSLALKHNQNVDPHLQTVVEMLDSTLTSLAVKSELCEEKFELKINNIRFVGHPVLVCSKNNSGGGSGNAGGGLGNTESSDENSDDDNDDDDNIAEDEDLNDSKIIKSNNCNHVESDLFSFNIVFALKANASHDIVSSYHDCSQRIAVALLFEEKRVNYLTQETILMVSVHDEVATLPEDILRSPYQMILEKSQLAMELRKIYEGLKTDGLVYLRINRWIELSFCVPQKVHRVGSAFGNIVPEIGPQEIKKCLASLRPYHGILLLVDAQELITSLPLDASPAFTKVVNSISPMKNLLELSADSATALLHVFHIVAQLIHWAKAIIIYPLCESNIYTVHPLATTSLDQPYQLEFSKEFRGANLLQKLSLFSLGVSLCQLRNPMHSEDEQKQLVRQVIWMLQRRLLLQIHIYVYLMPKSSTTPYLTRRANNYNIGNSIVASNNALRKQIEMSDFSIGAYSVRSEDSLATSPGILIPPSSKSESEDDLSSPKDDLRMSVDETPSTMLSETELTTAERESVLSVPAARNLDDLKLFIRLYPYFNGRHHLEDIMYYENVRRSNLLALIEKFKDVLFTCRYEDAAVAHFSPYSF